MSRWSNKFIASINTISITLASKFVVDNIISNSLISQCEWKWWKGNYFLFFSRIFEIEDKDDLDDDREILEFEMTRIVKRMFLNINIKSHMIDINIDINEIEWIKIFIRIILSFIASKLLSIIKRIKNKIHIKRRFEERVLRDMK